MKRKLDFDLYFITDRALSRKGVIDDVRAAIRGGVRIVQYREKELGTGQMIEEARKIAALCRGKAIFIVNDRIDVALASGADGVHIGPHDMGLADARKLLGPGRIIGVTAGSAAEAKRLEREGANYIGLSPIFATSTKSDAGAPIGTKAITEARKKLRIPFVAIGGINHGNLEEVMRAGARSVCMISALLSAGDVGEEVKKIRRMMHGHATGEGKE
jgi:thiamine-phosphate pyrophosphorylase